MTNSTRRVWPVRKVCSPSLDTWNYLFRGPTCSILNFYFVLWIFEIVDSLLLSFFMVRLLSVKAYPWCPALTVFYCEHRTCCVSLNPVFFPCSDYGFLRETGSDICKEDRAFRKPQIDICLRGHEEQIVTEG